MANMVGKVLESHKITFHEDELPANGLSHNKALHITLQYKDKFIARVLIDGGSILNICPLTNLKSLGIGIPEVLDISSTYNLLLGRPWMHVARAVSSTLHQAMKFEWNHQETTQHEESDSEDWENDVVHEEIVREVESFENKPKSNLEEIEVVNLGDSETVNETRISIYRSPSKKKEYTRFLKEYEDIFSWSYDDMMGLSTSTVAYKLPINPMCPPVKQKLRKIKPDMRLKIKEEVTKKIKAKVLRVVEYPTWIANIVPVLEEWATKNTKILTYLYCVQDLIKRFTKIECKHVPRIHSEFADALATLSTMIQHPDKNYIDPILIDIYKKLAYCA
uniref:Uncharacterized protein n=1 Tax=Nicotiana tabacum TaxID=4097 RepID=A0A1S3ZZD6_TOBAC|nr:PREDICTED: uncharacterized protein LOC107792018 [Nicotiana tabacum]